MTKDAPREPAGPDAVRDRGASAEVLKRIFRELASGGAEGLEELYESEAGRIFGLALWRTGSLEDANDVVQEVFLRLVASRRKLAAVADPRAWLLSVASNAAVDVGRRRKSRSTEPLTDVSYLAAPETDAGRAVDAARASRLLAELPAAQREAIYLHHFADSSFAAIGRVTGVPTFTAASRYRLGIARLRRLMEGEK